MFKLIKPKPLFTEEEHKKMLEALKAPVPKPVDKTKLLQQRIQVLEEALADLALQQGGNDNA